VEQLVTNGLHAGGQRSSKARIVSILSDTLDQQKWDDIKLATLMCEFGANLAKVPRLSVSSFRRVTLR
jgi:hypothetical protein